MKKSILLFAALALLALNIQAQTVTDIDGNIYNTVTIGTQIYTVENLKVTHYSNGDEIPNITDNVQWCNLTTGAYCNYDNDTNIAAVYGRLYNWYAVIDTRKIAPLGWHVPTYTDLDTLQIYLGYDLVAGGKLKETGTTHWMFPNTGASNSSGFTGLPGGQRGDALYSGMFLDLTMQGFWWSSEEMDTVYPWGINISYNSEGMSNWAASTRKTGFSVRLISDLIVDINDIDKNEYFNIYPNPAHDRISITGVNYMNAHMAIVDLWGKLLIQRELNDSKETVDISSLAPGMYFIQLSGPDWSVQKKLIKE